MQSIATCPMAWMKTEIHDSPCGYMPVERICTPSISCSFLSSVTKVSPKTEAVAAMNRSAGSWCGNLIFRLSNATSELIEASFIGALDRAVRTQASGSGWRMMRPFSARTTVSQRLIGEIHNSFWELSILSMVKVSVQRERVTPTVFTRPCPALWVGLSRV